MFSGFPGELASIDDFYLTSQQITVIETTNSVFNNSLFDLVSTSTVPYWVRVVVATRGAGTSEEWHQIFKRENSGTYNNQWMTVDYKLFTPREELPLGLFWVSEQVEDYSPLTTHALLTTHILLMHHSPLISTPRDQIPGFVESGDQTMQLQRGHWPSYNVPYYESVYKRSGYPQIVAQFGMDHSYQLAPRAPIFRQYADSVRNLTDMQRFMRLNRWGKDDPLFPTPDSAIAARADLMPPPPAGDGRGPRPGGAIDCKITSYELSSAMKVSAIAGPTSTAEGADQPVFAWSGPWANMTACAHYGHPPRFGFPWVEFGGGMRQ
jgi:hypothetical protein